MSEEEIITQAISSEDVPQLENIELLFFAYRDFVADPDRILRQYGFGRAHHRALFFVNRRPGLTVAELLDILKITKQSLARVLKQLIEAGHIVQSEGKFDRRKRMLFPTRQGRNLILELSQPQSRRINSAFDQIDPELREAVSDFLRSVRGEQSE
ncbi:MAG: MarR family transcriptional regulator [Pseudomonadota bacterium]